MSKQSNNIEFKNNRDSGNRGVTSIQSKVSENKPAFTPGTQTQPFKKALTPRAVDNTNIKLSLNTNQEKSKKPQLIISIPKKPFESTKENLNSSNSNDNSISLKDTSCETADVSVDSEKIIQVTQKKTQVAKSFSKFYDALNQQSVTKKFTHELADFEMLKVIGRGTFGKVVLVKSRKDQKLYALKCLKKAHVVKTRNLINLKNEKKILESINSPFIIKLKFTFQDSEKIFMGFDYHNGGELFFHLSKLRRFTEEMVRFYAAEIYLALNLLHKNNIIYRDLKPENIILDEEGHVKLIDFGLAKDKVDANTYTSTFCGTNEYIPPEVLQGKAYSHNFDWWGFGVLMYEMIFGRPPFYDQNKNNLFKKIVYNEPDYNVGGVKLSNECLALLKGLLHKDPKMRIKPNQIPNHPFFKSLNFDHVKSLMVKPPYKPKIKSREDLSNIDPVFLNEELISPVKKIKIEFNQSSFNEF